MATVADLELAPGARVAEDASVLDAAQRLVDEGVSGVAVVDGDERVLGVLTARGVIRSLFPPYLAELRHTAFVHESLEAVARRADEAAGEGVREHMSRAEIVAPGDSTLHAAELFLHSDAGVLVVAEGGRFVGVLDRVAFARGLLAEARGARGGGSG